MKGRGLVFLLVLMVFQGPGLQGLIAQDQGIVGLRLPTARKLGTTAEVAYLQCCPDLCCRDVRPPIITVPEEKNEGMSKWWLVPVVVGVAIVGGIFATRGSGHDKNDPGGCGHPGGLPCP